MIRTILKALVLPAIVGITHYIGGPSAVLAVLGLSGLSMISYAIMTIILGD